MNIPIKQSAAWLLLLAATILALTWIAWVFGMNPLGPGNASGMAVEAIQPWRPVLLLARWILWCLVLFRWEWLGLRLFRGDTEKASQLRAQWPTMRHRMMGGIAVVEVIMLLNSRIGG